MPVGVNLTRRQWKVAKLIIGRDMRQVDAARLLGIGRPAISKIWQRILDRYPALDNGTRRQNPFTV